MPRVSPGVLDLQPEVFQPAEELLDDILKEPLPPEMNEQAYEAIAEELRVAQVSAGDKACSVCLAAAESRSTFTTAVLTCLGN